MVIQERRRAPRYRLDTEIGVNDGHGRTIDVSSNSVFFESTAAFAPGDEVSLVFPFEHIARGTTVRCNARIVRVEARGSHYGIAATYEPVAFTVPAGSPEQATGF